LDSADCTESVEEFEEPVYRVDRTIKTGNVNDKPLSRKRIITPGLKRRKNAFAVMTVTFWGDHWRTRGRLLTTVE
jgi:hypothetical protein